MKVPLQFNPTQQTLSTAREEAARRMQEYETAAREVADLCDQARKTARLHRVPHAGMGQSRLASNLNPN